MWSGPGSRSTGRPWPRRPCRPGCWPRTSGWPGRPRSRWSCWPRTCMPNHPAVPALLAEAADRLRATTGSPALQGYQAGPERVDGSSRPSTRRCRPAASVRGAAGQLGRRRPEGPDARRGPGRPGRHLPRHGRDDGGRAGAGRHPPLLWVIAGPRLPGLVAGGGQRWAPSPSWTRPGASTRSTWAGSALVETTGVTAGTRPVRRATAPAQHLTGDLHACSASSTSGRPGSTGSCRCRRVTRGAGRDGAGRAVRAGRFTAGPVPRGRRREPVAGPAGRAGPGVRGGRTRCST